MIHLIKFKNFFSFKEEALISLKVSEKAPNTEKYIVDKTKTRLTKILAVFGHNAAGKTNALKAISFLQWFIVNAYTEDPDTEISISPFEFVREKKPTEMMVEFSIGQDLYLYYVNLTPEKVINEKLQKKILGKKKFKTLFERSWDNEENNYIWKDNFGLGVRFRERLRKNASVLATSIRDNHKESIRIFDFWNKISVNVGLAGKVDNEKYLIGEAAFFFSKNNKLKQKADELLQKFDLGLKAIEIIKKKETNHSVSFDLKGVHHNNYTLSFQFESSGTRKFFAILKHILYVLEKGGVAVLDEFDTDLHPMMSEKLLEMFFSKETNPHNAQLIFSAHSPHLLNLLDKYQIALTEKDKKGESEIWRLDEMKGVRLDDNYYAKYLAGAYGGVPNFDL